MFAGPGTPGEISFYILLPVGPAVTTEVCHGTRQGSHESALIPKTMLDRQGKTELRKECEIEFRSDVKAL